MPEVKIVRQKITTESFSWPDMQRLMLNAMGFEANIMLRKSVINDGSSSSVHFNIYEVTEGSPGYRVGYRAEVIVTENLSELER